MKNHPNRNKIKNWPKFLKEFRLTRDLSQVELADLLQISVRNIENWEEGVSIPPPYLVKALNNLNGEKK